MKQGSGVSLSDLSSQNDTVVIDWMVDKDEIINKVTIFLDQVFELYETRERVGTQNNIKFFIYPRESKHHEPHVHAILDKYEISISLIDYKVIVGNLPNKNQKIAIEWVKENIGILKSMWNKMHEIRTMTYGKKTHLEKL